MDRSSKFGWVWILISPTLWLMATLSTVESLTFYYVQFAIISSIALIGFVSGIASVFRCDWAYLALKYLSWICFVNFSGSGLVMIVYSIALGLDGTFGPAAVTLVIS